MINSPHPLRLLLTLVVVLSASSTPSLASEGKDLQLDVNDVSFLWPVPKTAQDVDSLISVDQKLVDGTNQILPEAALDALLGAAQSTTVLDSAGRPNKINLAESKADFEKPSTWKIAAIRIDPSAPGTAQGITDVLGSAPQIRLILQPVTVTNGTVRVHDVTAHLVFSYIAGIKPAASGRADAMGIDVAQLPPRVSPSRKFGRSLTRVRRRTIVSSYCGVLARPSGDTLVSRRRAEATRHQHGLAIRGGQHLAAGRT
jgi:hypothetical protein